MQAGGEIRMTARRNPFAAAPESRRSGLEESPRELVKIRASQIHGGAGRLAGADGERAAGEGRQAA
jgi:hypothetical protein